MGREHDRENTANELQDVGTIIGACRYCGQTKVIHPLFEISEEEADERATWECDCLEAEEERKKRDRRDRAVAAVKNKFGAAVPEEDQAPERVVDMMIAAIDAVMEKEAESVTISISKTVKAKISMTGKGAIKVEKTKMVKTSNEV